MKVNIEVKPARCYTNKKITVAECEQVFNLLPNNSFNEKDVVEALLKVRPDANENQKRYITTRLIQMGLIRVNENPLSKTGTQKNNLESEQEMAQALKEKGWRLLYPTYKEF
jgi:hypothetical protein